MLWPSSCVGRHRWNSNMMDLENFWTLQKPRVTRRCQRFPKGKETNESEIGGSGGCWRSWCLQKPPLQVRSLLPGDLHSDHRQRSFNFNKTVVLWSPDSLAVDEADSLGWAGGKRQDPGKLRLQVGPSWGSIKSEGNPRGAHVLGGPTLGAGFLYFLRKLCLA